MKTIFTDQESHMATTIKQVFPNAHHRLCLWHIFQNVAKHLSNIFGTHKSFSSDFRKFIYDYETEDEFLLGWEQLLETYDLKDNKWLNNLFKLREKWSQVYGREHFCDGMTTTQRSESINNYFKKYFKKKQTLSEFVVQSDKAVDVRREKARKAYHKSVSTQPDLTSVWEVEKKAAEIYTRKIFNEFHSELLRLIDLYFELDTDDGTTNIYKVSSYIGEREPRTVRITSSNLTFQCSCRKFEFSGILCAHILKVLRHLKLSDLPSHYYLKRWTKEASNITIVFDSQVNNIMVDCDLSLSTRYSELSHLALSVAKIGCVNEELSIVTKQALLRVLEEIKSHSTTQPSSMEDVYERNLLERDDEDIQQVNITVKDPIREKTRGESSKRHKGGPEKGKKGKKTRKGTGVVDKSDPSKSDKEAAKLSWDGAFAVAVVALSRA
ncbi:protein FAR1-RELATED SEQUENCE 5-like [Papaver somniferum]|uniref:protein FAR1-RELATED SEQUENCE 5-like n=1 Tax=Papaver somniferum TaxID=3469 RepID=UPI000E701C1B|nr:protein FAR1-RELATED SEQUENCE 5-like [Papaver somniferum]